MAFIRSDISRRWLPHTQAVLGSPLAEFTATTVALSVGMIALAVLVFGSGPGATVVALLSFGISAAVAARALHRTYPHDRLGLCNVITLARLALTASLVAPLISGAQPSWAVFAVAVVALGLDGFDGWLARRQGYVSDFGARFDMEVDSAARARPGGICGRGQRSRPRRHPARPAPLRLWRRGMAAALDAPDLPEVQPEGRLRPCNSAR
jgi:hypothetical protein